MWKTTIWTVVDKKDWNSPVFGLKKPATQQQQKNNIRNGIWSAWARHSYNASYRAVLFYFNIKQFLFAGCLLAKKFTTYFLELTCSACDHHSKELEIWFGESVNFKVSAIVRSN